MLRATGWTGAGATHYMIMVTVRCKRWAVSLLGPTKPQVWSKVARPGPCLLEQRGCKFNSKQGQGDVDEEASVNHLIHKQAMEKINESQGYVDRLDE